MTETVAATKNQESRQQDPRAQNSTQAQREQESGNRESQGLLRRKIAERESSAARKERKATHRSFP